MAPPRPARPESLDIDIAPAPAPARTFTMAPSVPAVPAVPMVPAAPAMRAAPHPQGYPRSRSPRFDPEAIPKPVQRAQSPPRFPWDREERRPSADRAAQSQAASSSPVTTRVPTPPQPAAMPSPHRCPLHPVCRRLRKLDARAPEPASRRRVPEASVPARRFSCQGPHGHCPHVYPTEAKLGKDDDSPLEATAPFGGGYAFPEKPPVQRRVAAGLPGNPKAMAMRTLMNEAETKRVQTVMFVNNIEYNNPEAVRDILQGAADKAAARNDKRDTTMSVLHRPRPIPRGRQGEEELGAGAAPRAAEPAPPQEQPVARELPSVQRSKSNSSATTRKSILRSNPGSPTQLPPLPPAPMPKRPGNAIRPLPNDTKSMTFDEKMKMFFPEPSSRPGSRPGSSHSNGGGAPKTVLSPIPAMPALPASFMDMDGETEKERSDRTTKTSFQTQSVVEIADIKKMPVDMRNTAKFSVDTVTTTGISQAWLPPVPSTQALPYPVNEGKKRQSSPIIPYIPDNVSETSDDRTQYDDATTNWGSLHSPPKAIKMRMAQPVEAKATYLPKKTEKKGEEIMTIMLDDSNGVREDIQAGRESWSADIPFVMNPSADLASSSNRESRWHHRVGDQCPTFSDRKEKTKSRKMVPPTPLLLGRGAAGKNMVIVRAAEPSPLESPTQAYREIQSKLKKLDDSTRDSVGSQGRKQALLDNLEQEMGQQEDYWHEMQNGIRDSLSTVKTSPRRDSFRGPQLWAPAPSNAMRDTIVHLLWVPVRRVPKPVYQGSVLEIAAAPRKTAQRPATAQPVDKLQSTSLWHKTKKAPLPAGRLWGSTAPAPKEKKTGNNRPVTQRPTRRSRRVTMLPDILESPKPLPDNRGTLGIFQFPWGERSDTGSFNPRPSHIGALKQLESEEYSSSFFDDYDEELPGDMDANFDMDGSDEDFDETTLWEIASLLKTDKIPSKNSLLPAPLNSDLRQPRRDGSDSVLGDFMEDTDSDSRKDSIIVGLQSSIISETQQQSKKALMWIAPSWPRSAPSPAGLFSLAHKRRDYRTTTQEPAALNVERRARISHDPLPVLTSTSLWTAKTSAHASRNWLSGRSSAEAKPSKPQPLRRQHRPSIAYRADWEAALQEALALSYPNKVAKRAATTEAEWAAALNEAIALSGIRSFHWEPPMPPQPVQIQMQWPEPTPAPVQQQQPVEMVWEEPVVAGYQEYFQPAPVAAPVPVPVPVSAPVWEEPIVAGYQERQWVEPVVVGFSDYFQPAMPQAAPATTWEMPLVAGYQGQWQPLAAAQPSPMPTPQPSPLPAATFLAVAPPPRAPSPRPAMREPSLHISSTSLWKAPADNTWSRSANGAATLWTAGDGSSLPVFAWQPMWSRENVARAPEKDWLSTLVVVQQPGMVKNLATKGGLPEPVLIYNRTQKRSEDLANSLGPAAVEITTSVEDGVARADVIFTCLADDDAVRGALTSAVANGAAAGKVFVDCSTIHPETTESIAELVTSKGSQFVAAPVFGAPAMAETGQLVCVLAGPRAAVDVVRPYFKGVMGRAEIDLADQPYSKATTLKVLGNTFIFNMVEQLAEGLVVAEKAGLGTDPMRQFVEAVFPGPYTAYAHRMLSGDYHTREEPLFAVDLARKDLRHARSIAQAAGVSLPNAETADAHLRVVREHVGEKGDIAGIYGAVRKEAGLKFENN
ncbi:unnamed protein product [Parascedosporium putredinis]|uniref:6-phosphogluconate dehydrogenase NADP-binding domain-containing protein n=1 Tax=Parascedosporium putredinis TaxID=1442378 RepID=A0A9P1HC83_9PEZI|nr:unnamed protein product [Parascedosporium putredinis]CAI8004522.1 unnamed protein product [Parascedosporium putredinis]